MRKKDEEILQLKSKIIYKGNEWLKKWMIDYVGVLGFLQ